jgi:hypothetical protein
MWGPAGRVAAAVYKTHPIMPRAGATGDAGGAAGGKERSTEAQTNNYECPANGPLLVGFQFPSRGF